MASSESFILLISGPSGAGKGSLYGPLLAEDSRLGFSISCTTREPREGEQDGREYHFLTKERFRELLAEDAFAEHADVHDQLYGTRRSDLDEMLAVGQIPVLDIDVQGGVEILKHYPRRVVSIFVFPPSWEELEARLRQRGTESDETLATRLDNARWEVDYAEHYDYWVVNDVLKDAVAAVRAILWAESFKRTRFGEPPMSG